MDSELGGPEVDVAREDLELMRLLRQTEALRRETEQERLEIAKREEAERVERENQQRLERLKAHGRSCVAGLPIEWRQRAISLLEEFVIPRNVPPSLPDQEAYALVAAQVQKVSEQYNRQQFRELCDAIADLGVPRLIEAGQRIAERQTASWDMQAAEEAKAEVARQLAQDVKSGWTEADVQRRVESILDEWEEEEDNEEEVGGEEEAEEADDDESGW
jgi:hypothetical protein